MTGGDRAALYGQQDRCHSTAAPIGKRGKVQSNDFIAKKSASLFEDFAQISTCPARLGRCRQLILVRPAGQVACSAGRTSCKSSSAKPVSARACHWLSGPSQTAQGDHVIVMCGDELDQRQCRRIDDWRGGCLKVDDEPGRVIVARSGDTELAQDQRSNIRVIALQTETIFLVEQCAHRVGDLPIREPFRQLEYGGQGQPQRGARRLATEQEAGHKGRVGEDRVKFVRRAQGQRVLRERGAGDRRGVDGIGGSGLGESSTNLLAAQPRQGRGEPTRPQSSITFARTLIGEVTPRARGILSPMASGAAVKRVCLDG